MAIVRNALGIRSVDLPSLATQCRGVQFYDINDRYITTARGDRDRQPVPLSKVSQSLRNAVLAAEDHHYYSHHGIDIIGICRASIRNHQAGKVVEGGSTITQQLVRNLYLDKNDRSYTRKIKEALLSLDVERKNSKNKILETYLNEIYFGNGAYGIERAANRYFSKHASQLTVPESAFIAGLIKSPTTLGSASHRNMAMARQHDVIDLMAEDKYITAAAAKAYKAQTLAFKTGTAVRPYPYYLDYALQMVQKEMGSDTWSHDLKVYTYLDPAAQKSAEAIMNKAVKSAPRGIDQGALVSMSLKDGAVLAMVGGVGKDEKNHWNRALFPHTAGSCFKPFVYLTGLTRGVLEPDTLVNDDKVTFKNASGQEWTPKNFDDKYKGWLTVRDALTYSRNTCAARVAMASGIDSVIETARAAGVKSKLDAVPSLALGACAISPLDMATSYGTLARYGTYMPPQLIRCIVVDGNYKQAIKMFATPSNNLPSEATAQLVDVMQDVVRRGTGCQASLPGIAVAGKTGTADGARDIWFSGFTPEIVTVVWAGSDKNHEVRGHHVTGGSIMASVWRQYMQSYYSKHKAIQTQFEEPSVQLAKVMPDYDQTTLLTTDIAQQQQLSQTSLNLPTPVVYADVNQIQSNVPTILMNERLAAEKGICKAFVVRAAEAARRWQSSEIAQTPGDQMALAQPVVRNY
ncbi:MAG TPA: PBP1A family penicillin-binding protein [Chroococcales cyanobacterium]